VLTVGQAARGGGGGAARLAGVALAAAVVSFAGIGSHSLWTPDEPRDAAVGKAMWSGGDLVVPRLNGRPFLEKPPLAWWAQAAAFQALGASDAAARVPSALFATLTLILTYAVGRRLGGERAGWLAAGALACTAEFCEDMGRAIVDPPLVLMVTLAYAGFAVLVTGREAAEGAADPAGRGGEAAKRRGRPAERRGAYLLICLAVPLAFLAKGVVGVALALGPPLLYMVATAARAASSGDGTGARQRRGWAATTRLLAALALLGVPLFVAIVLPWAVALLHRAGWEALRECLVGNTVGRLLSTAAGQAYGHRQPFWYYLAAGAAALLPWTLALPAVLRAGGKGTAGAAHGQSSAAGAASATTGIAGQRLFLACFWIGVALLSLAATKRALYLVPLLPALAVPIGLWLDRLGRAERRSRWDRPAALLLLAIAGCLPPALWAIALAAARGTFRSFPAAPLHAALSPGRLATAGVVAAAGAALLLFRLARQLHAGSTPTGPWLVVPFLALALVYQTAVKAAVEPLKNLHDLTRAVARLDPGAGPVAAYRPSETTMGIIDFDLDRLVLPLAAPADLVAFLAARPGAGVIISADALGRLPAPDRAQLRLLYDETGAKASPFAIVVRNAAAPPRAN
jgi:4-amino-4-deoxy-L-arabinose transferase-like glycosyltransferase